MLVYYNIFKKMVEHICKRCKTIYDNKTAYVRHINKKKKCKINKSSSKINKKNHRYHCRTCKKDYSGKAALMQHKKTKLHKTNINKPKKVKSNKDSLKDTNKGLIAGSQNKQTQINNSGNTTINNYYISLFSGEEINKLTTQDKLDILSFSNDNPIIKIIVKTNLNPELPEYHNVGYVDLKSGHGFIFNGKTWQKKEIRSIMNELLNYKRRDLVKIHKQVSKYLSTENNKNINEILFDVENIVEPKLDHQVKFKKNLSQI